MAAGPTSTPDPESASEVTSIKKGITMRVTVYIEGQDAPAHDFTETGTEVVNKLFSATEAVAAAAPFTVTLKKIEPLEGSDDSDEG